MIDAPGFMWRSAALVMMNIAMMFVLNVSSISSSVRSSSDLTLLTGSWRTRDGHCSIGPGGRDTVTCSSPTSTRETSCSVGSADAVNRLHPRSRTGVHRASGLGEVPQADRRTPENREMSALESIEQVALHAVV